MKTTQTKLTILRENETVVRENISPSTLMDEQIYTSTSTYQDPLVKRSAWYYHQENARHFVKVMDAVATRLTTYLSERFTCKMFAFYDSHDADTQQCLSSVGGPMYEHKLILNQLNFLEPLRAVIKNLLADGHSLLELYTQGQRIGYETYGDIECPPVYWKRAGEKQKAVRDPNKIEEYKVNYIPQIYLYGTGKTHLQPVRRTYRPQDKGFFHFTYGTWNYGFGDSILLRAWDSITKLRIASNSDQFLRDIRAEVGVPQSWKPAKILAYMQTLDNWTTNRWLVHKQEQHSATKEPVGLPYVRMRTMGEGAESKGQLHQKATTGETLQDPEYARLFMATGFSKMWWIGNEAGGVEGSEINFEADVLAEMQVFAIIEPIIKRMIEWFVMIGALDELPPMYAIKYWKEDEILKNRMAMAEQQQELMEQDTEADRQDDRNNNTLTRMNQEEFMLFIHDNTRWNAFEKLKEGVMKAVDWTKGIVSQARYGKVSETPGEWLPVNSSTGNVKQIMYMPAEKGDPDRLYIRFASGDEYGYFANQGENFPLIADDIQRRGGEAIYAHLRGLPGAGHYKPGQTPTGKAKKPPHKITPMAGEAHKVDYEYNPAIPAAPAAKKKGVLGTIQGVIKANSALTDLSFKQFNDFANEVEGHTFGKGTYEHFKKLLEANEKRLNQNVRRNSLMVGKPMDFNVELLYRNQRGGIDKEYACKRDWKKAFTGLTSEVQLFHKNGQFIIGTLKYGWDDAHDEPTVESDIDRENLAKIMETLQLDNTELYHKVTNGHPIPISTEYSCDIEIHNGKRFQRNFRNITPMALVDQGNCPDNLCALKEVE